MKIIQKIRSILLSLIPIVAALGLWELVARSGIFPAILLPPATAVLYTLVIKVADGTLVTPILFTLYTAMSGFLIASIVAIPAGLLLGWQRWLYRVFEPLVESLRPIPAVAIIPIAIIFLGVGLTSRIAIVTYSSFFLIFINALYGVYGIDKLMFLSLQSIGMKQSTIFRKLIIPGSMPFVFAGLRLALVVSIILSVATEMLFGNIGIGHFLMSSVEHFRYQSLYAGVLSLSILGYTLNKIFLILERRVIGWSQELSAMV
ncbi:MAG: ABC transporter permease [Nitrosopumilus sp.]